MKCLGDIYKRLQMGKKTRLPGFTIIEIIDSKSVYFSNTQ